MSRRGELLIPSLVLDRTSGTPLHRQIRDQMARGILSGAILAGARLPSTRFFARLLGVSRNTVFTAYDDLAADHLIHGERGAGMRVSKQPVTLEIGWVGLKRVIHEANYPARILAFGDTDGNPLYIRF